MQSPPNSSMQGGVNMLTVPYEFYTGVYGGSLTEEQFKKQMMSVEADVNYYTNDSLLNLTDDSVDTNILYDYRRLCCILADKGQVYEQGGGKVVKSMSSGKVSESYLESSLPANRGVETISLIEKYLSRYNFCCRWV